MKIVQTLWIPREIKHPASFKSGWASAEYHWLSWALSVLQLRKFYDDVELFTTRAGKEFVEELQLPYSNIKLIDDTLDIPPSAWALAKINTYKQQIKPFLHVDGDVFLFNAIPKMLCNASLICQSKEIDFFHYEETLRQVQSEFEYVPDWCKDHPAKPLVTYNAGIFGGNDLALIKEFCDLAFRFVGDNKKSFLSIENSTAFCMLFEQYLFSDRVRRSQKNVDTFFEEPVHDTSYPGLGDFWNNRSYVHLMGMSKKNRFILKQMMNKTRQELPENYYHVLRTLRKYGVPIEFKIYSTADIDPLKRSTFQYSEMLAQFDPATPPTDSGKLGHFYAKDAFIFAAMEKFTSLNVSTIPKQRFAHTNDVVVTETNDQAPKYLLKVFDTFDLGIASIPLEKIEFAILEILKEQEQSIEEVIEFLIPCFDDNDVAENRQVLEGYVIEKFKSLMSYGAIRWIGFKPTYTMQHVTG